MLVEYDVLARDHQDAYVSFIILVNFCQWWQVLFIFFYCDWKERRQGKMVI